jgi:hypothetical protein
MRRSLSLGLSSAVAVATLVVLSAPAHAITCVVQEVTAGGKPYAVTFCPTHQ